MSFRTTYGQDIFGYKYKHQGADTWPELSKSLAWDVCGGLLPDYEVEALAHIITEMKFIPAGRYLYYAGRPVKFFNNCFSMLPEDSREEWALLMQHTSSALLCGGGVGVEYSKIREEGAPISRTGGTASGPIPLMKILNEIGRNVMQGGSRRSALWAGLAWNHPDVWKFIKAKDWPDEVKELKANDFNFPADLDMTNISVSFTDRFFSKETHPKELWETIVRQMCVTGEPGVSVNLSAKGQAGERGRNACCEFITDEDSDLCNLGSLNFGTIEDIEELAIVCELASKFLVCGSIRAELPYPKCIEVRTRSRKIGLGLMGVHEWLLKRNLEYGVPPELHEWLEVYQATSEWAANEATTSLSISPCKRFRAIAPAGTISILAGTTSGIEPLFAAAVKRRYLVGGSSWKYQYLIDPTAQYLIDTYGIDPDKLETAYSLSNEPERRIKFQADIQQYVDMGISSTINLPEWGSPQNNEDTLKPFGDLLLKYAPKLRGFTVYPNGGRPGQVLNEVPFKEAQGQVGVEFDDFASDQQCKSGVCGI